MYDFIIVGAGFAGSVLAHKLATKQNKKILIIDRRSHIGGNCYDSVDAHGILIHNYGPHIFHTDKKRVWKYLSQFTEWHNYHHKVEGFIDGQFVPIPFNLNTLYTLFPAFMAESIEKKLVQNYGYGNKITILALKQIKDKELKFIADFIYEKIFLHYSAKQWGKTIEQLDSSVSARVPVAISKDDRYFYDPFQAMPREGYTKLFEKMLDHPNIDIKTDTEFTDILWIQDNAFIYNSSVFKGEVIFTGMIDELFDFKFGNLPYRSIELVFENHLVKSFQNMTTTNALRNLKRCTMPKMQRRPLLKNTLKSSYMGKILLITHFLPMIITSVTKSTKHTPRTLKISRS